MSTSEASPVSERVRVGVVGLGAVAQAVHLPLLDRLPVQFRIAAVADLSRALVDAMGERYRVPANERHLGVDALLESQAIDALVILTSGSHGAATIAGLDRGLPVFVEKPLAFTLAEADAIASRLGLPAETTSGSPSPSRARLQVGYMKLHDPAVVRALEYGSESSGVGPVRSIEVTVLHPTSESQLSHARLVPPAGDVPADLLAQLTRASDSLVADALGPAAPAIGRLYASILLGSVVHELSIIRAFAGDPVAIDSVDVWPDGVFPPSVAVSGRLPAGGRFTIRWHFLPDYPAYREEVRVVREGSTIELEFPSPYLLHAPTALRITETDDGARRDILFSSVAEAFENELLAFHKLVVDGTPPRSGLAEGRADIVTCQRIAARHAAGLGIEIGGEAATVQ